MRIKLEKKVLPCINRVVTMVLIVQRVLQSKRSIDYNVPILTGHGCFVVNPTANQTAYVGKGFPDGLLKSRGLVEEDFSLLEHVPS